MATATRQQNEGCSTRLACAAETGCATQVVTASEPWAMVSSSTLRDAVCCGDPDLVMQMNHQRADVGGVTLGWAGRGGGGGCEPRC